MYLQDTRESLPTYFEFKKGFVWNDINKSPCYNKGMYGILIILKKKNLLSESVKIKME